MLRRVIVAALLLAPAVMAAVALVERRLGPSAAGWVAALPASFSVAVVAVALDAGGRAAGAMALSAGTHVPAQVLFAAVFAGVLRRRGLLPGAAAGTGAYVVGALALADVPAVLCVACAIPVLALAPRVMAHGRPRPASPRRWTRTALTCAVAPLFVAATLGTSRLAGPQIAGAVAAFPTISTLLAVAVVTRDGAPAGAHALTGLVRSLPCYLAFCLAVTVTAPAAEVGAVPIGVGACLATAGATWRGVRVARAGALATAVPAASSPNTSAVAMPPA
jgi:hypothetical protein